MRWCQWVICVGYPPKLKHWVTIWAEPLVLARGEMVSVGVYIPKLKHWVTIWAEPLVLARGERVP